MSADNGIYILKTKDQYRVAHLRSIENIYWSIVDNSWYSNNKYVPTRVVEMWGDCKFTKDWNKALNIANMLESNLSICEYGVRVITYNKTWKDILKDAEKCAKKEIEYITAHGKENLWDMEQLYKIANGVYLKEWTNKSER